MAEYIDREKLLEHIKDLPTWEIDDKGVHDTKYPKGMFDCEDVVSSIENAPAADVEHVIRCKDCKYSRSRNELEAKFLCEGVLVCTNSDAYDDCWNPVFPEHFCSYGESKEIESDEVNTDE